MTTTGVAMRRPLSPAQLRVWQAGRSRPGYSQTVRTDLHGPLDADALRAAISRAVREDESLRLRFTETGDGPEQVLGPMLAYAPEFVDATPEEADKLIGSDLADTVDIERGPLFRHVVLRLGPRHHVWYFRVHHIVHDGHSLLLTQNRVADLYNGHDGAGFGSLCQALDQRDTYLRSAARRRDAGYWEQLLDGAREPTPGVPRERAVGEVAIDGPWEATVVAAVAIDRWRRTGCPDVVLNVPLTGRVGPAERTVPGMLFVVVPLRVRTGPGRRVDEVVADAGAGMRKALWHQRFPLPYRPRPHVTVLGDERVARFGGATAAATLLSTGSPPDSPVVTAVRRGGRLHLDIVADGAAQFPTLLTAVAEAGQARLEDVIR